MGLLTCTQDCCTPLKQTVESHCTRKHYKDRGESQWSCPAPISGSVCLVEVTCTLLSPLLCTIDRGGTHLSNPHRKSICFSPPTHFQHISRKYLDSGRIVVI